MRSLKREDPNRLVLNAVIITYDLQRKSSEGKSNATLTWRFDGVNRSNNIQYFSIYISKTALSSNHNFKPKCIDIEANKEVNSSIESLSDLISVIRMQFANGKLEKDHPFKLQLELEWECFFDWKSTQIFLVDPLNYSLAYCEKDDNITIKIHAIDSEFLDKHISIHKMNRSSLSRETIYTGMAKKNDKDIFFSYKLSVKKNDDSLILITVSDHIIAS